MLLVIVLDNGSNIKKDIDGLVFNLFILIIQKLIKHPEDFGGGFILFLLGTLFLHKLNERNELVEQCNLDFADFTSEDV